MTLKTGKELIDQAIYDGLVEIDFAQDRDDALKKYESLLNEHVAIGIRKYTDDFFIAILQQVPQIETRLKVFFELKMACPTPDYDQTVYKYHKSTGHLEYIWTVPDKATCKNILANWRKVDPSEHGLLNFVIAFAQGDLFRLCQVLNGEEPGLGSTLKTRSKDDIQKIEKQLKEKAKQLGLEQSR